MQLSDILEENTTKTISKKTRIPEGDIENLLAKNFENLKRVKALGFISIIEREYKADLVEFREEAQEYYNQLGEDKSNTLGVPIVEERKGNSKFFIFVVLALLGYATWYFLVQFDKKHLSEIIPFMDEASIESFLGETEVKSDTLEELSIGSVNMKHTLEETPKVEVIKQEPIPVAETVVIEPKMEEISTSAVTVAVEEPVEVSASDTLEVTQTVEDISPKAVIKQVVSIVPVSRLWFGLVDMQSKQRDHFSISDLTELDVATKSWLVATSSAPFSLLHLNETKEFNDAREHYFKVDRSGVMELSKSDYIAFGGWPQW